MTILAYLIPIVIILICVNLGFALSRRGRYRPLGLMFLAAAAGFWLCVELGDSRDGWDGIGYAIVALLGIIPAAGGLFIGLVLGWLRRRRDLRAHV